MARKDHETFDQGCDDNSDHNDGQRSHDLTENITDQEDRHKGRNGRQACGKDRRQHRGCPVDSRVFRTVTHGLPGRCMLTDHNRIINNHTKHHDEGEHGDHVDALAHQPHDPERCHHGDRNASCDPKRDPCVEEQEQNPDHEHETSQPVFDQQVDAALHGIGADIVFQDFQ
ncbi:hypothetical protein LAX5112_02549 [Roseibium alexandrii]|uniref:Uncharacterized protein n=1 Tax=Roseibium alexandrii TaxID=388408 RepID=A0A0M7A7F5_9HYPH|nr:hypothetical protein LAX5112_02549 [Roseibium alexandrii]